MFYTAQLEENFPLFGVFNTEDEEMYSSFTRRHDAESFVEALNHGDKSAIVKQISSLEGQLDCIDDQSDREAYGEGDLNRSFFLREIAESLHAQIELLKQLL